MEQLTTSKKIALGKLKETTYFHALDELLVFPGLGTGLALGNVEAELAGRHHTSSTTTRALSLRPGIKLHQAIHVFAMQSMRRL